MDQTKTVRIVMDPDAVDAIRKCKTSDLILTLAHPEGAADSIANLARNTGAAAVDANSTRVFWEAIAAEIDRRIPVPDPRIGKLARPASSDRPLRVVGVDPGGALWLRGDDWPTHTTAFRVDPALIAPGGWLDG